jgi:pentatricopeptide repeat protein
MFLELCFLAFFLLGFAFLRFDKLSRRRRTKGEAPASPFALKLKAIRSEFHAGNGAAVVDTWAKLAEANFRECCTLDVLRMVTQCILEQEDWEASLKQVGRYLASFPDPFAAMNHSLDEQTKKKFLSGVKTADHGRTVCLNQLLHVAGRQSRSLDGVVSVLREVLDAQFNDETYEILLGAYAVAGDEPRVEEMMRAMKVVSPRGYTATVIGFVRSKKLVAARRVLGMLLEVGCGLPPYALTELTKATVAADGPVAALDECSDVCSQTSVVMPTEALASILEDAVRRGGCPQVFERIDEIVTESSIHLSYPAFDCIVKGFAQSASLKAIEYFEKMVEQGYHLSEGSCVGMITHCADSKFLRLAEHVVRFRRERNEMTLSIYSALMKVYACSKLYNKCCDLYPEVLADGIEPDSVMVGCLMNFAARAGRSDLSEKLFTQSKHPAEVQNYMSQIRACRQTGDVQRALWMLRELQGKGLGDKAACNSVLDVCVCAGRMDEAAKLFQEMKASTSGYCDIVAYNTLIKGHCTERRVDRALELFHELKERGLQANDVSYNSILNSYIRDRCYREAWEWYEMMRKDGMKEDSYTISTLAKALKTCNDEYFVQNVFKMLDETEVDITSDEVLLNVVLDAFVRLKDMRRLNGVVRKVKDMRMVPPVATVNTIMKAFSSLKRIDEAMELWRIMTEVRELEPNEISIGCVTDALVSNDRVDDAAAFLTKWKERIPLNTVIYSTLIKGFAITRQADRALEAFDQMQAEGIAPNLVTMNTLIDACARSGHMARCGEILEDMQQKHGVDPDRITYSTIVKGFCLAGEIQQAIAVMESARRRGFPADVIIFNTILDACSSRDKFQMCDKLFAQMVEEGVRPTNFTLTVLIKRYGREGNVNKGFELIDNLPQEHGFKANAQAHTCLISACVINKQMSRAMKVFERMKTKGPVPDSMTYEKLISGWLRIGDAEKACELVRDAYGLNGPLGRSGQQGAYGRGHASGHVTPGGHVSRVQGLDPKVLERMVEQLSNKGLADSHAVPLVQELRGAGVSVPQKLVSATLRGAVANQRDRKKAPWAKGAREEQRGYGWAQ